MATISFPAKVEYLQAIREFVQESAVALGADPDAAACMIQAVDEVATNVIIHGYQGKKGEILIALDREGADLVVSIRDHAPAFDPTQVPKPDLTTSLETRALGGLGVYFVKQFCDFVQYHEIPQGGNELILRKKAFERKDTMDIQVIQAEGQPTIAMVEIQGDLDASNYEQLIAEAVSLKAQGVQQIVMDLSKVNYVSSAGLVALHRSLLVMNGVLLEEEDGWGAMHALAEEKRPLEKRIKLVGLQPRVDSALDMAGMKQYFEIYTDIKKALAASKNAQRV
ncbi:MAG TPA: ATP-binding protein [Anaerolineaceae bacterium]|nr:ATP-binding protein [Anaerolineaceae bacterium]